MHPSEADLALLQRYSQRRDEEAFAEIVRRYASVVYATCHRILRDSARAEEVSQEAFFRLLQKPESVTRSLGGWLHRTATQLSIDVVRSDSARRKRELKVARSRSGEVSRWEDLSPLVDEALAELPEHTRTLLVRHFLQGRSQSALAVESLVSPATVSRRVKAGLEALRAQLRNKGVLAGAALLSSFFAEGAAEAAPGSLVTELGKMAMVSGAAPTAGVAASGALATKFAGAVVLASAVAATAILLVVLVAMFTGGSGGNSGGSSGQAGSTPAAEPTVPATVAGSGRSK